MAAVLFSGHMIDAPERERPRFPPSHVHTARLAVATVIAGIDEADAIGISGLACGGDLIFAELWLAMGRRLLGYLPRPVEAFLDESVRPAGPEWVEAFDRVVAHPSTTVVGPSPEILDADDPHTPNNQRMLAEAIRLSPPLHAVVVWDGRSGDGPGGTAHLVAEVLEAGGTVATIEP